MRGSVDARVTEPRPSGSGYSELLVRCAGTKARALAGEDFENQKIRGMETCHRDVIQVFIALRNVLANQDAKLLHR